MTLFGERLADSPLSALTGKTLDDGDRSDPEGCVWLKGKERLCAGQFALERIPVYHDRMRCPVAHDRGAERMRRWPPSEAREYAIPCWKCVVPGEPAEHGLTSAHDVLEAMDDPPDLAVDTAAAGRFLDDGGDGERIEER